MKKIKIWDAPACYLSHKGEFDSEMQRVLSAGKLILQEDVESFEENLARFVGKKYAVGVNSGTDAIFLALRAIGIGVGDSVATVAHTPKMTIEAIKATGASPAFVDIDQDYVMDLAGLSRLGPDTKAVIPVHLAGENVPRFNRTFPIIEDAAQALGSKTMGYGLAQCFSFYPAKILGAFGDAGGITTDDESLARELKGLRDHYRHELGRLGFNSRLDNLQAAVLNVKMKYLPEVLERRAANAKRYIDSLGTLDIVLPFLHPQRVWQDFLVLFPSPYSREKVEKHLNSSGIETLGGFPTYYSEMKGKQLFDLPQTESVDGRLLRLPVHEYLTEDDIDYVIMETYEALEE